MMKHVFGALASVALVATSATAALACGEKHSSSGMTPPRVSAETMDQPTIVGQEERMDEVAGVRIVPSVIAKDISLTPSAWILRDPLSRNANASAKVYTNQAGEITGLTITSLGLPNPERINARYNDYVVWLVDTDTNEMRNIGVLESKNGGQTSFGYSPQMPLRGFDRIVITPETAGATRWPSGWQQLTADIPMTAMVPMEQPVMPRENMPRDNMPMTP